MANGVPVLVTHETFDIGIQTDVGTTVDVSADEPSSVEHETYEGVVVISIHREVI